MLKSQALTGQDAQHDCAAQMVPLDDSSGKEASGFQSHDMTADFSSTPSCLMPHGPLLPSGHFYSQPPSTEPDRVQESKPIRVEPPRLSWIEWFCGLEGHEFLVAVDPEFIRDKFNLLKLDETLNFSSHRFKYCLQLLLA